MNRIIKLFFIVALLSIVLFVTACTNSVSKQTTAESQTATSEKSEETVAKETKSSIVKKATENIKDKSIALNNSYTTNYQSIKAVEFPKFTFDYPDNWKVIDKDVTKKYETVTLSNNKGSEIKFSTYFYEKDFNFNQGSYSFVRVKATKAASSQFVPSVVQGTDFSNLGKFAVAKIHQTGVMDVKSGDSDYRDVDGKIAYAVIPESELGIKTELSGIYEGDFVFWYNAHISFIGTDTGNDFTEKEQQEVIAILNSFRLA